MANRDDAMFREDSLRPRHLVTLRAIAATAAFLAVASLPVAAGFAAPPETGRPPGQDTCTSNCWSSGLPNVAPH